MVNFILLFQLNILTVAIKRNKAAFIAQAIMTVKRAGSQEPRCKNQDKKVNLTFSIHDDKKL
jgi:hypothetical protein